MGLDGAEYYCDCIVINFRLLCNSSKAKVPKCHRLSRRV